MDTNQIFYISGLFDGEGSIGISKTTKNNKSRFKPFLSISMNDIQGLNLVKELFGGNIRIGNKRIKLDSKNNAYARAYIISYSSYSKIKEILTFLLPSLRVKKEQAITMLEFIDFHENNKGSTKFLVAGQKNNYYRKLKTLKKKNWNYD